MRLHTNFALSFFTLDKVYCRNYNDSHEILQIFKIFFWKKSYDFSFSQIIAICERRMSIIVIKSALCRPGNIVLLAVYDILQGERTT